MTASDVYRTLIYSGALNRKCNIHSAVWKSVSHRALHTTTFTILSSHKSAPMGRPPYKSV